MPACRSPWSPRNVTTLVVATAGFALNVRAWVLLGQHLHERFGVGTDIHVVLMCLPLLVAALMRLPVGVLTDRFGARVTFPAVSLVASASVLGLGFADSLPLAVVAGACAGVGGAGFVIGGSLVARAFPYGKRGLCLGLFSLGSAVSIALPAVSRGFEPAGRPAATVLAGLLAAFAVVAALVLRDPVPRHRTRSLAGRCVELVRVASGTSLSLLYALALGGVMAITVYLPVHLSSVYHMGWVQALTVTCVVLALSATARLAGGWWMDRRPTTRPLVVWYAVAAALCVVAAAVSNWTWPAVTVIAAIGVCDGVAGGALLALIGKAARPESVGAVMGVTGAAAALGTLPSVLLVAADQVGDAYPMGWILLAGSLAAAAIYVRRHELGVGLGLAVPYVPEPGPAAMTVAMLGDSPTPFAAPALVARLAELAVSDELVVVYGSDEREPPPPKRQGHFLVAGLRNRLPRYQVVAVRTALRAGTLGALATMVGELVETGAVTIAMTPNAELAAVAAELSDCLQADRVLQLSYTLTDGAGLHEIWNRGTATCGAPHLGYAS